MNSEEFLKNHYYDLATPSIKQYLKVKSENLDAILLFQIGDFFEMFFQDAILVHKILGLYLTHKGMHNNERIPMCGIPIHSYKRYITQLVKKNYTVVLCEQTQSPEEAKKKLGYKAIVERKVTQIITQGTILDKEMFDSNENNFLLSITEDNGVFGISYIDISTGDFLTFSSDNNNFISDIVKINPSEILTINNIAFKLQNIQSKIIQYPNHIISNHKANLESFMSFFNIKSTDSFKFLEVELQSIILILHYLKIIKISSQNISFPKKLNNSNKIFLDLATIQSLNLKTHVFKSINYTETPFGYRLLKQNIIAPLKNLEIIQKRLNYTKYFVDNKKISEKIQLLLSNMSDIERELSNSNKSHQNIIAIAKNLEIISSVATILPNFSFIEIGVINEIANNILNNAIDTSNKIFIFKEDTTTELKELNQEYKLLEIQLENLSKIYFPDNNIKISKNNLIGTFIEISKKSSVNLHSELILKNSTLSVNRYTSTRIINIENQINDILLKIQTEEEKILNELYKTILNHIDIIKKNIQITAYVDMFNSFAFAASKLSLSYPIISNSFDIEIQNGFHIFLSSKSTKNSSYLSNQHRNFVITGPNMSGKSTFLRQNAIILILAQIGSFVPAEKAKLSLVDNIFSRIGASDDIEKGHSTFMVEMIETASILQNATKNSFIVLDEVGRGTSTDEGQIIAYEILRYIHDVIQCKCIFATHYHDITKNDFLHSKNLTVEILQINNEIKFSYKIIEGYVKNSYAIYTAKIAGIPQIIIDNCKKQLEQ